LLIRYSCEWNGNRQAGAPARIARQRQRAFQQAHPFSHADQPQAALHLMPVLRDKASSIILDMQHHVILMIRESQQDVHGAGMFGDVAQGFLCHPKQALRQMTAQRLSIVQTWSPLELSVGNVDTLTRGLASYVSGQLFSYSRAQLDLKLQPEGFTTRALSLAETAAVRAAYHAATRRPIEARAGIEAARKADAAAPGSYEVEGVLLEADRKGDEARAAYASAIENGSSNFFAHYRWATLSANANTDAAMRPRLVQALERSIALNDAFAPAYSALASVKLDLDQRDEALRLAKHAVALAPGDVQHRLTLARVLWRMAQRPQALGQAREALSLAHDNDERRIVQEMIDFFTRNMT